MEINVCDSKKQVEVWMTRAEQQDDRIQAQMKELYKVYQEKKYLVAVFLSGDRQMYQNTLDLLAFNKKRVAELEVQRSKARAIAAER